MDVVDVPALYQTHWRHMVRLAILLVDDSAHAEDIVQDAFIALYRNQHQLRSPHAAIAYLRTSVVNLGRSALRRRMVARKHLAVAERDETPGADSSVLLGAEHLEVLAAVRGLPQRQREVLVLRYWSNLSESEIAETLGISAGTVKSSASRGIASLRSGLEGVR
ncbi:MAG: SigE family RNA polymerase sigma factor [Lapillicoccus sp.]